MGSALQVLLYFLDAYVGNTEISYPEEQLIVAARLLIKPLLERTFQKETPPVNDEILQLIVTRLFENPENTSKSISRALLSERLHPLRILVQSQ